MICRRHVARVAAQALLAVPSLHRLINVLSSTIPGIRQLKPMTHHLNYWKSLKRLWSKTYKIHYNLIISSYMIWCPSPIFTFTINDHRPIGGKSPMPIRASLTASSLSSTASERPQRKRMPGRPQGRLDIWTFGLVLAGWWIEMAQICTGHFIRFFFLISCDIIMRYHWYHVSCNLITYPFNPFWIILSIF